jgi:hypothetical protein
MGVSLKTENEEAPETPMALAIHFKSKLNRYLFLDGGHDNEDLCREFVLRGQ